MNTQLTNGSLFAGVGGFDFGAEQAGIPTIWNCEIIEFNRKILKQNFPGTKQYEDVTKLSYPEPVAIISGGFPCQDISIAGNGGGIIGSRSKLWGSFARIIHETRPGYVVIENSPMLTKRGFERVLFDLSEIGYDAEWQCLSGLTFGVQQRRERIYTIAYPQGISCEGESQEPVFRESIIQEQYRRISPGWRTRSDIPKPRGFRSTNDLPDLVDRNKAIGNAVMPVIARYIFECIKAHHEAILCQHTTAA